MKSKVEEIALYIKDYRKKNIETIFVADRKAFAKVWTKWCAPSLRYKKAKHQHFYEIVSFVTDIEKIVYVGVTIILDEFVPDNTLVFLKQEAITAR